MKEKNPLKLGTKMHARTSVTSDLGACPSGFKGQNPGGVTRLVNNT